METKFILSIGFILLSIAVLAQSPPPATPIDGGLSILLAAGVAYGLKKISDARKK